MRCDNTIQNSCSKVSTICQKKNERAFSEISITGVKQSFSYLFYMSQIYFLSINSKADLNVDIFTSSSYPHTVYEIKT